MGFVAVGILFLLFFCLSAFCCVFYGQCHFSIFTAHVHVIPHLSGLLQDCSISSALAIGILPSHTKPSTCDDTLPVILYTIRHSCVNAHCFYSYIYAKTYIAGRLKNVLSHGGFTDKEIEDNVWLEVANCLCAHERVILVLFLEQRGK